MEKLSGKELLATFKKILKDSNSSESEFFHEDFDEATEDALISALGRFKVIKHGYTGKFSDDSKEEESVVLFEDHNIYIGVKAWYNSWTGTEMGKNGYREVEPVEVTSIEYLPVKS